MRYKITRTWIVEADNNIDAINMTKKMPHVMVEASVITLRRWLELGGADNEHTESFKTSPTRDKG